MGQLDDLLGELASEGTRAASGSFGIDADRAREKMQKFQLANPYAYVLELVQAAHLLGASKIDIEVDADELWMTFDGEPFSPAELGEIYSAAMGSRESARARASWHIAIAFNALSRLDPKIISITAADAQGQGTRLDFTSEKDFEVIDLEGDHDLEAGHMQVYVRERARLKHLEEFFTKFYGSLPELSILNKHCGFAEIPISVNGGVISGGLKPPEWLERYHTFEREGVRGVIGAFASGRTAELEIFQHGVLIRRMQRDELVAPFFCRVEANNLNRDLSLSAFVEDERWQYLFFDVLAYELRWALLQELRARDKGKHIVWPQWTEELAFALFKERADLGGSNPSGSVELEILKELKHAPVWRCSHQPVDMTFERENYASIIEIRRALKGSKVLHASNDIGLFWPGVLNLVDSEDARAVARFMELEYKTK
jgi:hypothetical protein